MSDKRTRGPARRLVERTNELHEHARETASFGPERAAEWQKLYADAAAHDAAFAALVQAAERVSTYFAKQWMADDDIAESLRDALDALKGDASE